MISREQVLSFLQIKQESHGGYTGNDITELAEFLNVTPRGLNRRLAYWIQNDKEFSSFIYLGKEKPSLTLSEFLEIEQKFVENPIQIKKGVLDDIKTYGGADLNAICERLTKSKEWFSMYNVKAMRFYPQILTRNRFLKNILTSIHPAQKIGAQIRLFFELQAAYVIECMDLFIDEIIRQQGRMRQSDNASRQKTENKLRKAALEKLRKDLKQLAMSGKIEPNILLEYSNVSVDEELQTRMKLLEKHSYSCQRILELMNSLTSNMTQGVKFHRIEAKTVYSLATGETKWDTLNENEKRSIAWNPDLVRAIDNGNANIVPVLAFNRFIDYIRKGKVTFEESYYYQDIGE